MNDKIAAKDSTVPEKDTAPQGELGELKREMRSAQWTHWAQSNQKSIIVAIVAFFVVLVGAGLWQERDLAQRESAATLYQQALSEANAANKHALLETVAKDFSSSSYGALALMQLARIDPSKSESNLNALIEHAKAMPEWKWQARLDLAAMKIEQGDHAAALALLQSMVGKQYQQLRHYLMAMATVDVAEKAEHLQKALDAVSRDDVLQRKIKSLLAQQAS